MFSVVPSCKKLKKCFWPVFIDSVQLPHCCRATLKRLSTFIHGVPRSSSCCLKSSLLLAFCFLFVCMVDPTRLCPSSTAPLGLFQGIICNIERLKRGPLEPWITGGPDLKVKTSDPSSYHDNSTLLTILSYFSSNALWILIFFYCVSYWWNFVHYLEDNISMR